MKKNRKGFTLAELLIVVAIIAVLVAIAIPVFTTQLERSREATDISNVRAAYAEVMTEYIAKGAPSGALSATASARQTVAGWQGESGRVVIRVNGTETEQTFSAVTSGNVYTVTVSGDGQAATTVSIK